MTRVAMADPDVLAVLCHYRQDQANVGVKSAWNARALLCGTSRAGEVGQNRSPAAAYDAQIEALEGELKATLWDAITEARYDDQPKVLPSGEHVARLFNIITDEDGKQVWEMAAAVTHCPIMGGGFPFVEDENGVPCVFGVDEESRNKYFVAPTEEDDVSAEREPEVPHVFAATSAAHSGDVQVAGGASQMGGMAAQAAEPAGMNGGV